jgi:hypothetical protein
VEQAKKNKDVMTRDVLALSVLGIALIFNLYPMPSKIIAINFREINYYCGI